MSLDFQKYTQIAISALEATANKAGLIAKKNEILDTINLHHKHTVHTILFYGFNPAILAHSDATVYVTAISDITKNMLDLANIAYIYIDKTELHNYPKAFDWVIAADECFTFAGTEDHQRDAVSALSALTKKALITTLRDYKNQDFREREFSKPLSVYNSVDTKLYLEHHVHDTVDRYSWQTTVHAITDGILESSGPFARRSMFFKQLAKFSKDAGSIGFYVHKDLMYKNLIRKNYEHVISILF